MQHIVSSDLRRALQTAELVAAALGTGSDAIIALPGLRERHLGVLQARAAGARRSCRAAPRPTRLPVTWAAVVSQKAWSPRRDFHITRQAGRRAQLRPAAQAQHCSEPSGRRHRASLQAPRPQGLTRVEAAATAPLEYAALASADGAPSGGETVGQLRRRSTAGEPPARRQRTATPTACSLQSVSVC